MLAVRTALLLIAFVFFVLAGLEVKASRLDFTAVGLALVTLAILLEAGGIAR